MADKTPKKIEEVKVFARYIHMSPRKLRLVADMIRNHAVDQALEQLRFSSKNAAMPIAKAINSGIANAQHNLDRGVLYIKSLTIDGGPVYKRYAPRAQGRAFVERKRTSHINLVLGTRQQAKSRRSIFQRRTATLAPEPAHKHDESPESGKVE